jgi:uncharacterized protein
MRKEGAVQATFEQRVRIVREFLDAIGDLDFDRVEGRLAADAVMRLPFVDGLPPTRGRSAIVAQLRESVPAMFERMNFTYDEFYDVGGDDAVIAEYRSECPQRGTGEVYRNTYITVFRFAGAEIVLYKEYLNPMNFTSFR